MEQEPKGIGLLLGFCGYTGFSTNPYTLPNGSMNWLLAAMTWNFASVQTPIPRDRPDELKDAKYDLQILVNLKARQLHNLIDLNLTGAPSGVNTDGSDPASSNTANA